MNLVRFRRTIPIALLSLLTVAYTVTFVRADLTVVDAERETSAYAGTGDRGKTDGPLSTAAFTFPTALAYASDSKTLYVADTYNNEIRAVTASGVTTLAGSGSMGRDDGAGSSARFSNPYGLTYDAQNKKLYIADSLSNRIREVATDGMVRTIAGAGEGRKDGTGADALFLHPRAITFDARDGDLYVVDENNLVRRVTTDGVVTTFAGSSDGFRDATGTAAAFSHPCGIDSDPKTGDLFVSDAGNARIRKIALDGTVTTLAGGGHHGWVDGPAAVAEFLVPCALRYDAKDNSLYVVDAGAWAFAPNPAPPGIRKILLDSDVVLTVAGGQRRGYAEGAGPAAQFSSPLGIAVDPADDSLYVSDSNNNRIRKLLAPEPPRGKS